MRERCEMSHVAVQIIKDIIRMWLTTFAIMGVVTIAMLPMFFVIGVTVYLIWK